MNNIIKTIGKFLFAIPMAYFGINHLIAGSNMAGFIPPYIPGGVFWIYLTGLGLIASAVSLIINVKTKLAMLLLAFMLTVFVLTMHLPGVFNPATAQASLMGAFKDLALVGAALVFSQVFDKEKV
jgi:putative oxidoreductase